MLLNIEEKHRENFPEGIGCVKCKRRKRITRQKDIKAERRKDKFGKNAKKSIGIGCVSCSHRRMQLVAACCGKTFSCLRNNFISPGTYLAAIILAD